MIRLMLRASLDTGVCVYLNIEDPQTFGGSKNVSLYTNQKGQSPKKDQKNMHQDLNKCFFGNLTAELFVNRTNSATRDSWVSALGSGSDKGRRNSHMFCDPSGCFFCLTQRALSAYFQISMEPSRNPALFKTSLLIQKPIWSFFREEAPSEGSNWK